MSENVGQGPTFMETKKPYMAPDAAGGAGGTGKDNEPNRSVEDALANRAYYRVESLNTLLITDADDPHELFWGLRGLLRLAEKDKPGELDERYTSPRMETAMDERAQNLSIPIKELVESGIIRIGTYNPETGEGIPKKRKYAQLTLRVDEEPIIVSDRDGTKREVGVDLRYIFGTQKERSELAEAYRKAVVELETRTIMGGHIGLRLNEEVRDSIETMAAYMRSGRTPKFKGQHLESLFNLPSLAELRSGKEIKEAHELGDQVEEAVFMNLIMLSSGSKDKMLDLLARPYSKVLIKHLADKQGEDVVTWMRTNVGNVAAWKSDMERDPKTTWREETRAGDRGRLTEWSNIAAWGGGPGEFGKDYEDAYIEKTIGGLCGSVEASWVAATMMRVTGTYASEGYIALPNGKFLLPLGEDRYISGDDMGKLRTYMFNMKEGLLGQSSALKDMIGKMPDFAMNLFDWAQVAMNDLPLNPDGSRQKRSVWDAWLGTAEQPMRSLLTGKVVGEMTDESEKRDKLARGEAKTFKVKDEETHTEKEIVVSKWVKEEPGHRLGSLNFNSLPRGFHGTFTIMQWLAGNEKGPTGVFVDTQEMDYRYEDFKLATLKKKRKYIRIIGNGIVLSQGSPHLYEDAFGDATVIQRNLFRNIMLARIHSQTFAEGILNMKVKFFNPEGGGDAEVPAAVLIRAFVKEALKDNPRNEEELKKHYIDENATLRKLGKKGTPGVRDDISALLDEKFEPERVDLDGNTKSPQQYEKELEQMKYVGTIKGKNKF